MHVETRGRRQKESDLLRSSSRLYSRFETTPLRTTIADRRLLLLKHKPPKYIFLRRRDGWVATFTAIS